jgi:hypothetical protein
MQFKKVAVVCAMVCATLLASVAVKAASDPQTGTWKFNAAKSLYSPGPAAKSVTLTVWAEEKSVKIHSEGIDGEGKATKVDFTANFDGKDYPATGITAGDMVSVERVDGNTLRVNMKKDGQTVMTVTSVVSADGKQRTSTFVGKDTMGHDVKNVVVYDKE